MDLNTYVAGLRPSDDPDVAAVLEETDQLVRIIAASILTARKNRAQACLSSERWTLDVERWRLEVGNLQLSTSNSQS